MSNDVRAKRRLIHQLNLLASRSGVLATLLILAVLLLSTFFTGPMDARPMHGDEAVNAFKLRDMLHGQYDYDPAHYHGPTLYYLASPLSFLAGDWLNIGETGYRSVTWLAGAAIAFAILLLGDGLKPGAAVAGAVVATVSYPVVFYRMDFIHEPVLVLGVVLVVGCAWRAWQTRHWLWAVAAGASLGFAAATKETFVVYLLAGVLSLGFLAWFHRGVLAKALAPAQDQELAQRRKQAWGLIAIALLTALLSSLLLFSQFGFVPGDALDGFLGPFAWLWKTGDINHTHPWYQYLLWYFWPVDSNILTVANLLILAFALLGSVHAFFSRRKPFLVQFLLTLTILSAVIYCCIPYKTPWSFLGVWVFVCILSGQGLSIAANWLLGFMSRALRPRLISCTTAILACMLAIPSLLAGAHLHNAWQNPMHPFTYAQPTHAVITTAEDVIRFTSRAKASQKQPAAIVMMRSPWPLPWYLRGLPEIGWYESAKALGDLRVPVILTDDPDFAKKLIDTGQYIADQREIRHADFAWLLINLDHLEKMQTSREVW